MRDEGSFSSHFLPDFCRDSTLLLVILVAELLAVVLTLAHSGTSEHFWRSLALISLFVQWIALGWVALLCRLGAWLNRLAPAIAAGIAYAIVLLITLTVSALTVWLANRVMPATAGNGSLDAQFVLRNALICAIVAAVGLRYMYMQHEWKRNIEARTGARLAALQARIRPHFLFNSMNSIAALIRSRPAVAETAVLDLAEVFRSALEEKDWSTLSEEFELSRHYLALESLRLGDRLQVEWDVESDLGDVRLPALSLQPLVENAVYHGIQPRPEGGAIRIGAHRGDTSLCISIDNPLPTDSAAQHRGNGIAVSNLQERLALAYRGEARLETSVDDGRYLVQLTLPMGDSHARHDRG